MRVRFERVDDCEHQLDTLRINDQEEYNKVNTKLRKQQKFYKDENQMLTEEYHRIARQYKDLHKKMRNFSQLDYKRFCDIWLMNEAELRKLVEKVVVADK